jgi:hypothetical protein
LLNAAVLLLNDFINDASFTILWHESHMEILFKLIGLQGLELLKVALNGDQWIL